MLEIMILIALCRRIGEIARDRDRNPFWFQVMTIGMWFAGEVVGAILAVFITELTSSDRGAPRLLIYLLALIGAACGAAGAFAITKSRRAPEAQRGFAVIPSPPGPPSRL